MKKQVFKPQTKPRKKKLPPTTDWENLPNHPAAGILPMATEEEIVGMAEDIAKTGLRVPIEVWVDDSKEPTEDDSPRPLLGDVAADAITRSLFWMGDAVVKLSAGWVISTAPRRPLAAMGQVPCAIFEQARIPTSPPIWMATYCRKICTADMERAAKQLLASRLIRRLVGLVW